MHNRIAYTWWWVTIAALGVGLLFSAVLAGAHDELITACNKNIKIDKVFPGMVNILENGLVSEAYSLTPGGPTYIEALSSPMGGEADAHQNYPLFYIVDVDLDGYPDHIYIDIAEPGMRPPERCEYIKPYTQDGMVHGRKTFFYERG